MSSEATTRGIEDTVDSQDTREAHRTGGARAIQEAEEDTGTQVEQVLYAKVLEMGMYLGLVILLITFALYVSGVVPPAVPRHEIPNYWSQGVDDYLEAVNDDYLHMSHPPTGWAWVDMLGKGDFLNFVGIAMLAGVTIVCYLVIVPMLLRKRDYAYVTMALLEAFVLTLAASGMLAVGH